MNIRAYTIADASLVLPIMQEAYTALTDVTPMFDASQPQVFIGDPTVATGGGRPPGTVCRLRHYRLPTPHPILAGQMATHLTDLIPLPIAEANGSGFIVGQMAPLLAEGLGRMAEQYPALAALPVWAFIPTVLTTFMKAHFFTAATVTSTPTGSYIRMGKLSDAAAKIAGLRPH